MTGADDLRRLVKGIMGLDEVDGVVRVSLCHYNTGECESPRQTHLAFTDTPRQRKRSVVT